MKEPALPAGFFMRLARAFEPTLMTFFRLGDFANPER
jgi:hypothetical protein